MTGIGVFLIVIAAAAWVFGFGLDAAAPVSQGGTNLAALLAVDSIRQSSMLVGGSFLVAGCVLIAAARLRDAIRETARSAPPPLSQKPASPVE
jgi:hypothetical protein